MFLAFGAGCGGFRAPAALAWMEGCGVSIRAEQGSQRHRTHTQTTLEKKMAARN